MRQHTLLNCNNSSFKIDVCKFIENLSNYIFSEFRKRKIILAKKDKKNEDIDNYNYCNLSMTSPEYFVCDSNSTKTSIDGSNGIHSHIAYLYADNNWLGGSTEFNFFPLGVGEINIESNKASK
jgi:hypothetical protein